MTGCTLLRKSLFGEIIDGAMRLSDAGRMVEKWWRELKNKFPTIEIDAFTTMPNHFHGIVIINHPPDAKRNVEAALRGRPEKGHPHRGAPTLGDIVDWFKTMTTNGYIRGVKTEGWPPFPGRLWQRNYYEHVIRNENEMNLIREYIQINPAKWAFDKENPDVIQTPPAKKEEIENILGARP
jgi:REP element-mobilizing transposase RayT